MKRTPSGEVFNVQTRFRLLELSQHSAGGRIEPPASVGFSFLTCHLCCSRPGPPS